MRYLRVLYHPIFIFVVLQIAWVAVVVLWVVSYVGMKDVVARFSEQFESVRSAPNFIIAVLITGCVLLAMMLFGTTMLFAFGQRQHALIRQQKLFVSSVTHELRSPLASIQLALETLVRRGLSEEVRQKVVKMSLTDVKRLQRLVDQILVSSRFDRGLLPFEKVYAWIELKPFVAGILSVLKGLDDRIEERLQVDLPGELHVYTIPPALELILLNLLENAIKYSPKGAPIQLSILVCEGQMKMTVVDHGLGFSKSEKKRLFGMFYRSETASQEAVSGTGLGLFIVRSAVTTLKGKVTAESKGLGKGACFTVVLPQKQLET